MQTETAYRAPGLDSSFFTWNLDSGFQSLGGSGFLELYSEFQSPLFLILQTRLYWIQIPQAKITWIPESRFALYDSRDPTEPGADRLLTEPEAE